MDAAANSQVVVAVVSKQYTERYWCMLELDLALNAHSFKAASSSSTRSSSPSQEQGPVVIPVFYDSVDDVLKPQVVGQHWSSPEQLVGQMRLWVDADAWASNLRELNKLQGFRRRIKGPTKDEQLQLAWRVVDAAAPRLGCRNWQESLVFGIEDEVQRLAAIALNQQEETQVGWVPKGLTADRRGLHRAVGDKALQAPSKHTKQFAIPMPPLAWSLLMLLALESTEGGRTLFVQSQCVGHNARLAYVMTI